MNRICVTILGKMAVCVYVGKIGMFVFVSCQSSQMEAKFFWKFLFFFFKQKHSWSKNYCIWNFTTDLIKAMSVDRRYLSQKRKKVLLDEKETAVVRRTMKKFERIRTEVQSAECLDFNGKIICYCIIARWLIFKIFWSCSLFFIILKSLKENKTVKQKKTIKIIQDFKTSW